MNNRAIYRFGPFRLDPARCTLQRRDEQIQLPPKVFKCLVHLLDNRDRVVSRDGLLNAIWGTEHLSPGVVAQTVLQVRQALGDTGEAQLYIKTVRGFGYRWTAPVEIDEPAQAQVHAPKQAPAMVDARVALLLPLTVSAAAEDGWVRLGVMDFINERLRAAGLSMVSSDTVISLLAGHVGEPDEGQLDRLSSATGAQLLLAAQAIRQGTRWIVSVRTINGAHAALTTAGEAHDVIEAARFASDRMADVLGLSPTDEADKEPEPQRLAQQVQAAHLAGEVGDARALLDKASAKLREHPDIRFSLGHVELLSGHYEAAQRILEGLLPRSGGQDSASTAFQAKVLNALSYVHLARSSDWTLAESFARRALALLGERVAPVWAGAARLHLGIMVMRRGDTAAASVHFTLARWIFHRNGQLFGLAATDEAAGDLESLHERPATALRHYRSAVERYSALGRRAEELRARAAALTAHLDLLDREAAAALAPRLRELAARVDAPSYLAFFKDAQARLEIANGRPGAAEALFGELLALTRAHPGEYWSEQLGVAALGALAELALGDGEAARASDFAGQALRLVAGRPLLHPSGIARSRAWLTLVRSLIARNDWAGARTSVAEMAEWAGDGKVSTSAIRVHLAKAELAAAEGREEEASAEYERALNMAEGGQAACVLLSVAQSYLPWLLEHRATRGTEATQRALSLSHSVSPWVAQCYGAAVLQLKVYHAMGDEPAWRAALEQARSLAGERRLPPELQIPSRSGPLLIEC